MSDEHEHHHPDHSHEHGQPALVTSEDAGSQALAEALRSSFAIVKVVMLLMVLAFFGSGFFQVGPQEKAVILRFGRLVGGANNVLLGPGLHWSLPYPIDEVVKIPSTEIQKVTSNNGWYFTTPTEQLSGQEMPPGPSLNPAIDGYLITADRNIVHVRATLYYHIENSRQAVFGFSSSTNLSYGLAGVSNAVLNVLDNALIHAAAHFKVDDILLLHFNDFRDAVLQRVGQLADEEKLGIGIDNIEIDDRKPPRQLQDVFAQVTTARENRVKALQDALSKQNQITNSAGAQAATIIAVAQSARNRYVTNLVAEAGRFTELLPTYESNPSLFAQQTFLPVMAQVLTNVQDKIYLSERVDGKPRELRLMLNREPPQPKTAPATTAP
jgi:modulator of FtsH protease HflK